MFKFAVMIGGLLTSANSFASSYNCSSPNQVVKYEYDAPSEQSGSGEFPYSNKLTIADKVLYEAKFRETEARVKLADYSFAGNSTTINKPQQPAGVGYFVINLTVKAHSNNETLFDDLVFCKSKF